MINPQRQCTKTNSRDKGRNACWTLRQEMCCTGLLSAPPLEIPRWSIWGWKWQRAQHRTDTVTGLEPTPDNGCGGRFIAERTMCKFELFPSLLSARQDLFVLSYCLKLHVWSMSCSSKRTTLQGGSLKFLVEKIVSILTMRGYCFSVNIIHTSMESSINSPWTLAENTVWMWRDLWTASHPASCAQKAYFGKL